MNKPATQLARRAIDVDDFDLNEVCNLRCEDCEGSEDDEEPAAAAAMKLTTWDGAIWCPLESDVFN